MSDCYQVVTTIDKQAGAETIAQQLVERRLAACVQIVGPVSSTYRWQGAIETSREWLCLIKTTAQRYREVEAAIVELHPYDEPEILATPIVAGSAGYMDWLRREASGS